jgi:WD40 repeat protein
MPTLTYIYVYTELWRAKHSSPQDRTIKVWDINTGKLNLVLEGHSKGVRSLAYSTDYRFLVSAGFDYDAMVWNPYVENLILRLHGHAAPLCNVEIIPNSPQIITADVSGVFKIWDARNFACMQTFICDGTAAGTAKGRDVTILNHFAYVPTVGRLVGGGRHLHMFDYESVEHPDLTDDEPVSYALYNSTLLSFLTVAGCSITIWDARTGMLLKRFSDIARTEITSVCLDDRERKFVVGDQSGHIQVHDFWNGNLIKECAYDECGDRAHSLEVSGLAYARDHKVIISAGWDTAVLVHDELEADEGVLLRRMTGGHTKAVLCVAYSHNLSLIATLSEDVVQVWDFEFGRIVGTCTLGAHQHRQATAIAFVDPFPYLIVADTDGGVVLWTVRGAPAAVRYRPLFRFAQKADTDHDTESAGANSQTVFNNLTTLCEFQCSRSAAVSEGKDRDETKSPNEDTEIVTIIGSLGLVPESVDGAPCVQFALVASDETGKIFRWDLTATAADLAAQYQVVHVVQPQGCENARRKIRWDAREAEWRGPAADDLGSNLESHSEHTNEAKHAELSTGVPSQQTNAASGRESGGSNDKSNMKSSSKGKSKHSSFGRGFRLKSVVTTPKLVQVWQAHSDMINSIQITRFPRAILTCSIDRRVKVFTFDGELLGTLAQGRSERSSDWRFRIDMGARQRTQMQGVDRLLVELAELEANEPDDDDPHGDRSSQEGKSCDGSKGGKASELATHATDGLGNDLDLLQELRDEARGEATYATRARGCEARNIRRTPRMRPVDRRNAGKGFGGTAHGRKLRAGWAAGEKR